MGRAIQAVLVALLLTAGALAAAQQEPPAVTFRAEVNYVEVDAFVTDAQGRIVTGLTADDFELREDGRPQKISTFAFVDIPVTRAERPLFAAAPVELDVQTNAHVEGRVYLIVLDDQHVDVTRSTRVRAAARRFIEQDFGVNDLAAVVFTGGRTDDSQEFTNNTRLLLAAIDKFTGRKFASATVQQLTGIERNREGQLEPGIDPYATERPYRARAVMSTVRRLAEFMAGVRGRKKAMILISEGIDYDIEAVMGPDGASASAVLDDSREAIAAATRGNVAIYGIDPRGLAPAGEELIGVGTQLNELGIGSDSLAAEHRRSQDSLRILADGTGGFAALNRNDLDGAFDRIVSENSSYYLLGYYPANDRRAGRFRSLEVRARRPGLQVRSRRGYFEGRGRAPAPPSPPRRDLSPAIADAMNSPLPASGIPMKVVASAFKGAPPNAAVALAIELDPSRLDFVQKDGGFTEQLEVTYAAFDARGKMFPGERHTVSLNMKPDTFERVKANGLRVLAQMDLPPGRYQLRVAAGSARRAGSVNYDLEVPDFGKGSLTMSGVALTAASALRVGTIKPKDPLANYLPSPPTAAREFDRGDVLVLFTEFYENARNAAPHLLDFRADMRADDGRLVGQVADERSSTELQGSAGGYGFTVRFSLTDVPPGSYVIRVEGKSRADASVAVSRDIAIRVR